MRWRRTEVASYQHIIGGDLREDRHTKEMMPGVGSHKNAGVSPTFVRCMSPDVALGYRTFTEHPTHPSGWRADDLARGGKLFVSSSAC